LLTVRLPADANGKLVADGMRLVEVRLVSETVSNKVGNPVQSIDALGSETIRRYDDLDRLINVYEPLRDPTVTPSRPTPTNNNPNAYGWSTVYDLRAYGGDYLQAYAGDAADTYMAVNLPANPQTKTFAVLATWVSSTSNINSAPFTVKDASGNTLATVYIDQKLAPADYQDETGRFWEVVGVVSNLPPSSTTVWIGGSPGAQADAVRIIEIGPTAFKNAYDLAGNLTQVTDAKNNDTWFYRDDLGRVKEEKNELNESRLFEFYDNSQLKKSTDRNGRVIEHLYDNLGRQTEERWKNGAATVRSITFEYDANSNLKTADERQKGTGTFSRRSTSASVKLWNTGVTSGTVLADAVRVREVGTVERRTHNKVGNVTQTVDGLGTRRFRFMTGGAG
jgi:YD repeat-containing protein